MQPRLTVLLTATLGLLLMTSPARAQGQPPGQAREQTRNQSSDRIPNQLPAFVQLRVETVLATDASHDFDTRLTGMRSQLQAFRYSAYRLVQEERRYVGFGSQAEFSLPGGRFLQVVPEQFVNEQIALRVLLMEGGLPSPLMSTLLSIPNSGTLFVAGRKHQGGTLIIRIGASAEMRQPTAASARE